MSEKSILEKNIINFFSNKKEYSSLSNFWNRDVVISDEKDIRFYESGEHCFHGEKYIRISKLIKDPYRKSLLLDYGMMFLKPSIYRNIREVKKMGGKNGLLLSDKELELWINMCVSVQKEICNFKLKNYEEVRTDLMNSKGKILIHPALRCSLEKLEKSSFWNGRAIIEDGKVVILGKNTLGNIWMELRNNL